MKVGPDTRCQVNVQIANGLINQIVCNGINK